MSTQEGILIGAVPVVCFCLGGIWSWLRAIHRVLCEIKAILAVVSIRDTFPTIRDRIR